MDSIKFKINDKSPRISVIGSRSNDKKFLTKDLLYYHQEIPIGTVITQENQYFYESFVPKLFTEYNPVIIENVFKRQQIKKKEENIDSRTFVVLDYCFCDDTWSLDKYMRNIFIYGRDWNIMLLFNIYSSSFLSIPTSLVVNMDYVFIFAEFSEPIRKTLYESYGCRFPNFESFCQVLDKCTENHECIVINNTIKSNNLEDVIFWYKPEDHKDFKLGNRECWDVNDYGYQDDNI